jgi:hypothetical protein
MDTITVFDKGIILLGDVIELHGIA